MKIKEGGGMDIQKEKIKQEFWNWAKVENPRVVENAELGDVYATQILDHMFMGFAAAKAQAVSEWISMEDKYPKAGESVLICINGIRQNIAYFYDCSVSNEYSDHDWFEPVFTGGEAGDECVVKTEDVTHWMLLPKEPAND